MAGQKKGKEYCNDYFAHEDSWGQNELFECFTKYNVDFGKEFCDARFSSNKVLLMQCYSGRNVEKGVEFCDSNFDPIEDKKNFLLCYETIPAFTMKYCQIKYEKDIT